MKTKKLRLCVTCSGSGRVACAIPNSVSSYEPCPFCKGSGRIWEITEVKFEPYADPLKEGK